MPSGPACSAAGRYAASRGSRKGASTASRWTHPTGSPIEATVDRERADWIEITLDPREEHYLSLGFDWYDDRGYRSELYFEPESSPQAGLPYVVATSARRSTRPYWLDGRDALGRDGTWAARTLRQITSYLWFVS